MLVILNTYLWWGGKIILAVGIRIFFLRKHTPKCIYSEDKNVYVHTSCWQVNKSIKWDPQAPGSWQKCSKGEREKDGGGAVQMIAHCTEFKVTPPIFH